MSANVVASVEKKTKMEKKPVMTALRIQPDEGQRWWNIGRGRKDFKIRKKKRRKKKR